MDANKKQTVESDKVLQTFLRLEGMVRLLLDFIGDKKSFSGEELEQARNSYRELKIALKEESKRGDTIKGLESLNNFENDYLVPAAREAECRLMASTGSHPLNSKWHSELYSALVDLTHMRRQLPGGSDSESS